MQLLNRKQYIETLQEYICREHWEKPLFIYGRNNSGKRSICRSILKEKHQDIEKIPNRNLDKHSPTCCVDFTLPSYITDYTQDTTPIVYDFGLYNFRSYPISEIDIKYCKWVIEQTHRPVIMLVNAWENPTTPQNIDDTEAFEFLCRKEDWLEWAKEINNKTGKTHIHPMIIRMIEEHNEDFFSSTSPLVWQSVAKELRYSLAEGNSAEEIINALMRILWDTYFDDKITDEMRRQFYTNCREYFIQHKLEMHKE